MPLLHLLHSADDPQGAVHERALQDEDRITTYAMLTARLGESPIKRLPIKIAGLHFAKDNCTILMRFRPIALFNGKVRLGSRLCENAAEIAPLQKLNEFSRPQVDQKEENRKRRG